MHAPRARFPSEWIPFRLIQFVLCLSVGPLTDQRDRCTLQPSEQGNPFGSAPLRRLSEKSWTRPRERGVSSKSKLAARKRSEQGPNDAAMRSARLRLRDDAARADACTPPAGFVFSGSDVAHPVFCRAEIPLFNEIVHIVMFSPPTIKIAFSTFCDRTFRLVRTRCATPVLVVCPKLFIFRGFVGHLTETAFRPARVRRHSVRALLCVGSSAG